MSKYRAYLRAVLITAEMTLRQNVADMFILFAILFQPLIIAILALWMLQERGGDYAIFVVVGSGMSGLWSSLLFIGGNSITSERWTGTLEALVGSPLPLQIVVFGKNLAQVLQSLGSMVVSYLLVVVLFGLDVSVAQPGAFIVSLLLTVITFVCFGLIIASVFVLNPDVQRWQNGLEFPVYILAGFLFPIALLPGWTTPISYLLSPYWAAQALHSTSSGSGDFSQTLLAWGMMVLSSVIYLALSKKLFDYVLKKARVDATLGMQ